VPFCETCHVAPIGPEVMMGQRGVRVHTLESIQFVQQQLDSIFASWHAFCVTSLPRLALLFMMGLGVMILS